MIKEFSSLCELFIDNKLSIHFGKDKTKSILFTRSKPQQNWIFIFKPNLLSNIILLNTSVVFSITTWIEKQWPEKFSIRLTVNLNFYTSKPHSKTLHVKDYFAMHWFNPTLTMVPLHGTRCFVKFLKIGFRLLKISAYDIA